MSKPLDDTRSKWTAPVVIKDNEIHCPSTCVALGPIFADNDSKLIIAHCGHRGVNMKLKIFEGLQIHSENTLADMPTAITHFVNEMSSIPSVAVVAGASLLIFKSAKAFYKYAVQGFVMNEEEAAFWRKAGKDKITREKIAKLYSNLTNLSEQISFSKLTSMSQTYLLSSNEDDHYTLIERYSSKIVNAAPITCMTKMLKSAADGLDVLITGSENCTVDVIDSQSFTVIHTFTISSVPVTICAYGTYDVDYRIFVQTRDSLIYALKRDDSDHQPIIVSQSMITSMILLNKNIVYATCDNLIHFFSFKGKKINTVKCQQKVKMLEPFQYIQKQYSAVIAVFEKEIRLYSDSYLLDTVKYEKPLSWVKYGCYGREDATLIVCFKDGTLAIQIFRRTANFNTRMEYNQVAPAHALKLQIPKKTKIFIDQTQRELEFGVKIHQAYQKNLFNLKFKVAEVYQQLTSTATATVSTTSVLPLDISVDINGFGPTFRMTIHLLSASKQSLYDMHLSIISDPELYEFEIPLIPVNLLTPGQTYSFTTFLTCKDPEKASNGEIRALLVHAKRATPIVTAVIKMPFSEFPID